MMDFTQTGIALPRDVAARLHDLKSAGFITLDRSGRAEAQALQRRWILSLKAAIAAAVLREFPNRSRLARSIGMDASNISAYLAHPERMSEQFIALLSLADERFAMAFPAFREATDWFWEDPRAPQEIVAAGVRGRLQGLLEARGALALRVAEACATYGEGEQG